MYLNTNFTQKEIADKLGINPKTIYLWIKKGKWDEMKAAARQAPGIIQQQLYNHITAINDSIATREDAVPTFQEVEMLRKLIVSTKHMQQMSVGTYIQAFQEFTGFIGPHTNDLEFTKRVAVVADEYIKGLIHNKQFHVSEKVQNTTEAIKEMDREAQAKNNMVNSPLAKEEYPQGEVIVNKPHLENVYPQDAADEPTYKPHNTSLSPSEPLGGTIGPARMALPVGHQSGDEEKEDNPANPSLSNTSVDISTNPFPDSTALPDREIVAEQTPEPDRIEGTEDKEKHAREVEQIITREDYIKYEYLLEDKTNNPAETVDFNGVKANLMTVQYNLKQFEEPEWRRQFLPREEVIRLFTTLEARR